MNTSKTERTSIGGNADQTEEEWKTRKLGSLLGEAEAEAEAEAEVETEATS